MRFVRLSRNSGSEVDLSHRHDHISGVGLSHVRSLWDFIGSNRNLLGGIV